MARSHLFGALGLEEQVTAGVVGIQIARPTVAREVFSTVRITVAETVFGLQQLPVVVLIVLPFLIVEIESLAHSVLHMDMRLVFLLADGICQIGNLLHGKDATAHGNQP